MQKHTVRANPILSIPKSGINIKKAELKLNIMIRAFYSHVTAGQMRVSTHTQK